MSKFAALAGTGKPFRALLVLDGQPLVDKNGKQGYIDVHSEDSAAGRRFDKEWRDYVLSLAKDGKEPPTPREHNAAKCAALTASWYLVNPATLEPIDEPCTVENAKECYSLSDTGWLWAPAWVAANNNANFIKRSASGSTSMQSGGSETAAS